MSKEDSKQGTDTALASQPTPLALPDLGFRRIFLSKPISPCILSKDDLKRLSSELLELAIQSLDKYLVGIERPSDQSPEDWAALLEENRKKRSLSVFIMGRDGEQVMGNTDDVLDSRALPERLKSILFESATAAKFAYSVDLDNRFRIILDFEEPSGFSGYDPWQAPTPNASLIEFQGSDSTWVNGGFERISSFLKKKGTNRGWLHSRLAFNLLNWIIVFPVSLLSATLMDSWLASYLALPTGVRVAANIYFFFLMLMMGRAVIGLFRWWYPLIELVGTRSRGIRAWLGGFILTLILSLISNVIWLVCTGKF